MACGGCGKRNAAKQAARKAARAAANTKIDEVMGGYGHLTDSQIKARLEVYKKKYCSNCEKRYECNYEMYSKCKKNK